MAVSGKTAAPHEIPYFLGTDKPPDMAAVTKAMADQIHARLSADAKKSINASGVSSSAAGYTTFDEIENLVLLTDGLIFVTYEALLTNVDLASGIFHAALFLNGTQLKDQSGSNQEAASPTLASAQSRVLTTTAANPGVVFGSATTLTQASTGYSVGQAPFVIEAAAGEYDIAVKVKPEGVKAEATKRKLRAWAKQFA